MKEQLCQLHTEIRISTISNVGYGVFALKNFKQNEIIEECPFLALKEDPQELKNYLFFQKDSEINILPLGYGCLYNHSELPNATWDHDENKKLFIFKALKNINKGEEIFIYYAPKWFPSRGTKPKTPPKSITTLIGLLTRITLVILLFIIFMSALLPYKMHRQQKFPATKTQVKPFKNELLDNEIRTSSIRH